MTGHACGVVEVLDLANDVISAATPVPGARYLAQSHNGNRVLVFGSRPDTVTVLAKFIGSGADPRTDIQIRSSIIRRGQLSAAMIRPPTS